MTSVARRSLMHGALAGSILAKTATAAVPSIPESGQTVTLAAHGAMAHAFEMDNLTKPDSGCHPGSVLFSAALATAQDKGLSGQALHAGNGAMVKRFNLGRGAEGGVVAARPGW